MIFEKEECMNEGHFWIDAAENKEECLENVLGRFGCLLPGVDFEDSFFMMKSNVSVTKGFIVKFGGFFD